MAKTFIDGYELRPGDLRIVQDPKGSWRLCECAGHSEIASFGDVVFKIGNGDRFFYLQEGRSPAINSLIGKPFATPKELKDAMLGADANAFSRHRESVSRFEVRQ